MKKLLLASIKFYQNHLSFTNRFLRFFWLTDSVCRFSPSCSEYSYQAIERYGIIKGTFLALGRIIRCNPLTKGGLDPVK